MDPVGLDARAPSLNPDATLPGEAQDQLIPEEEGADLAGAGELVVEAGLPGDGVAVVDDVLAVDINRLDGATAINISAKID